MSTDKHTDMRSVHYMVRFKAGEESWVHQEAYTQQVCRFPNTADAEKVIKREFQNKSITEAIVIKVSEEIEYTKKNIDPVIESKTTFDVEVFNRCIKEWSVRRCEFEKLSDAIDYVKSRHFRDDWDDDFRIVQRDVTIKTSIV